MESVFGKRTMKWRGPFWNEKMQHTIKIISEKNEPDLINLIYWTKDYFFFRPISMLFKCGPFVACLNALSSESCFKLCLAFPIVWTWANIAKISFGPDFVRKNLLACLGFEIFTLPNEFREIEILWNLNVEKIEMISGGFRMMKQVQLYFLIA